MPRTPNTSVTRNALTTLVTVDTPQTREALGLTHHYIKVLLESGDVVQAIDPKTKKPLVQKVTDGEGKPLRGHPSNLFKLSGKGRKKAKRLLAKADESAEAEQGEPVSA